jgi:hypothetical protein
MGFLITERTPSASFDAEKGYALGTTWSGRIVEVLPERQKKRWAPEGQLRELDFWPDGKPVMEQPIIIQAEQVPPGSTLDGEPDDGRRMLVLEGQKKKAMREAIFAYPKSQQRELEVGDWVSMTWSGKGGTEGKKKLFTAQWKPGSGATTTGLLGNGHTQQAQAQPAQQQAPQGYQRPQTMQQRVTGTPATAPADDDLPPF